MAAPRSKDQRPCDNCRRRKIRCLFTTDQAINCILCESRSTNCTYIQSPPRKKRALPTASHEDEASSVSRSQPVSGRARSKQKPVSDKANVLLDYNQLSGRSLLKETLGHQNRQSCHIIGSTADFDPSLTEFLPWTAKGELPTFRPPQILRRANPSTYVMLRPDMQEEVDAELANLDAIEKFVSPHGPELVKIYFRIVHPSFPILHKNVFLEKHGRSYRELTPVGLGAVYILAMNWWSYSPVLSNLTQPNARELERNVLSMLFNVHRRPKISDLQGGLVLMQSPNAASWALTGHLVAMAQNLGINADCTDWHVPDWERGVRKRVAWALFMQDKWGSLVYGRGSHIRIDDWDVRKLELTDFPETAKDDDKEEGSADIEKGKKTFIHMVALTEIVADILDTFFTLKALRKSRSIHEVLDLAKPVQLRLKSWYASMPPGLSVDDTVPRKLSSVGYLHLAYYTAEITLHRAILRCHKLPLSPNSPSSDMQLYAITRRAAEDRFTMALDFVKRLKAEHFQSFWYFVSSVSLTIIGIFAGVLCAMCQSEDGDEAAALAAREDYIAKLAEYRWVLRISATGAEFMKYAVGILDAESQLLEEQFGRDAKRPKIAQQISIASNSPWSPDTEYRGTFESGLENNSVNAGDGDLLTAAPIGNFLDSPGGVDQWMNQQDQQHLQNFEFWDVNGYQQPPTP